MVIVLKEETTRDQKEQLVSWFKEQGLKVHESEGEFKTILGLVGDVDCIDQGMVEMLDIVDRVTRISEPYKKANRKFHPKDTKIEIGDGESRISLGGGDFSIIAGPKLMESEEQILKLASGIKEAGAGVLMGGISMPGLSRSSFTGMEKDGIEALLKAKKETGLPVISELMNIEHLDLFTDMDAILVGARNMFNHEMLKELSGIDKPVILRRGIANTMEELLMSAEYLMQGGNSKVILCESGIRTFERYTENTLDISAVPALHEKTHLPVIIDPSNSTGRSSLVKGTSLAGAAAGADGVLVEVHDEPGKALSGGHEAITTEELKELAAMIEKVRGALK